MQQSIYRDMCAEGIFMNRTLRTRLQKVPDHELECRWLGIKLLADRRRNLTNRSGWLTIMMWTDTALEVGKNEYQRIGAENRTREAERQRLLQKVRESEIEDVKWQKWLECPDKELLINHCLCRKDSFYQEFFRSNYLSPTTKIADLPKDVVLTWLSDAL